ncbi:hypothetical protein [Alkalispirochaeta alkalica]|uniref:hypothetical protein n=1 Tax=Alkalispirochaeta alkalica TaxID=46356 RepID=UPI00036D8975|nr:hypothetical protein [Alkalispirochaeta alkalica]
MERDFILPLGYVDEHQKVHRTGRIRQATTGDELAIQTHEKIRHIAAFRDVLLLSRVITRLGDYDSVTEELIGDLFEADFLYLQLLYKDMNGEAERMATVACPQCGHENQLYLENLYTGLTLPGDEPRDTVQIHPDQGGR